MTHASKPAPVGPAQPPDAWTVVEARLAGPPKAPANLYIQRGKAPFLRLAAALLDAIGDPNHVVVRVDPTRRRLRLVPDLHGARGRRIYRPSEDGRHGRRPCMPATGIPEALGIDKVTAIVRFDAEACDEHVTLTMRGEP